MKKKFLKSLMSLLLIGNILLINPIDSYAFSRNWTDELNDSYFRWVDLDSNQIKQYKEGLYEGGYFDGIENRNDWKTIYRIKNNNKYYLDSILQNSGFKNISVKQTKKNDIDYYIFNCNDESNNKIYFEIFNCVGWCKDTDNCLVYNDDIELRILLVNNKIPTIEYMDNLSAKPGGLGVLHGMSKFYRVEYGLEKKPKHVDYSKDKLKIRNIKDKLNDYELKTEEKINEQNQKYFSELYYEDSNKNKIRYDEKITNYNMDKQFLNDEIIAYFDTTTNDPNDFATSIMRYGPWSITLQQLMKEQNYEFSDELSSTTENETEKIKNLVFTSGGTQILIRIKCYKNTTIDNKNNQLIVDEYAMLTPLINGKPITYKEWQKMLNDGFYKTHATPNINRQLVETNIENIYGVGGARNYSL